MSAAVEGGEGEGRATPTSMGKIGGGRKRKRQRRGEDDAHSA